VASDYTIRESRRAKHVRLKVSLYDASLVVTVPHGFDRREIARILNEKRQWIERMQKRVINQRYLLPALDTSLFT
jgi:predicted metal-dependent hydrolase